MSLKLGDLSSYIFCVHSYSNTCVVWVDQLPTHVSYDCIVFSLLKQAVEPPSVGPVAIICACAVLRLKPRV